MDASHMHERRFHKKAELLRSSERIALLEVDRVVRSCIEGLSIQSMLDVGTGTGVFAEAFAKRGLVVIGIDPNGELLALARRYVPNADFREAAAEACVPGMAQSERGESPRARYKRSRRLGEGQGRRREAGSEGSPIQTRGATNRNRI